MRLKCACDEEVGQKTHLVLMLALGQLYGLLEDSVLLFQLNRLAPVIERAGDENFVGFMLPEQDC